MNRAVGSRIMCSALQAFALALGLQPDASAQTHPLARAAQPPIAAMLSRAPTHPLVSAARAQLGVTTIYDPAYVRLDYPLGDVPRERGVCTDVLIRALRTQGVDLQVLVHEDMHRHFSVYPKNWGLKRTDRSIDHRRVPNLQTFFVRQNWLAQGPVIPGDFITWMLPGNLPHIGIVSERLTADGKRRLILHNVGQGVREEDVLEAWPRTGHYRWVAQLKPELQPVPAHGSPPGQR